MSQSPESKPQVRPPWAATAAASSIVDPDTQTANFVTGGWPLSSVPPSRQYWNWVLHYCMSGVRYFARRGITDWDGNETYIVGDIVRGDDNVVRQSLQTNNTNNAPSSSPAFWGGLSGYALTGQLGGYVTTAQLNTDLAAYATIATLNADLSNYATLTYANAAANSAITQANGYTFAAIQNYYTISQINAALQNYVTNATFNATSVYLENYANNAASAVGQSANAYTNTQVSQTLTAAESYTNTQFAQAIGSFTQTGVNGTGTVKQGNGFEIRFGYSPVNSGTTRVINFPSFSNNILFALTQNGEFSSGLTAVSVVLNSPSQITLYTGASGGGMYWVAFGY